jgi:hypothetical protein
MSDYTPTTDFSAKDALLTGNPLKKIQGADIDPEFDNIATAVATKYDSSDLASQAQAEGGTSNVKLMTPLRTAQQLAASTTDIETIVKAAGETISNSTTLQDDDELAGFTIAANATYAIEGMLRIGLKSASDMKISNSHSVAPDEFHLSLYAGQDGAAIATGGHLFDDADTGTITTDTDGDMMVYMTGMLVQGGTGGTFTLQWAQNAAVAENTVLRPGSFISFRKIS